MAVVEYSQAGSVETERNRYYDNTELIDGVRYTTQEDANTLTNSDFLELMLEEMKQQDPTSPMDTSALMDSQLQMSTIQSNQDMVSAMTALQASYANSALSTAANMVGHSIKTGEIGDDGDEKIYKVATVDNKNGELYVQAQQFTGVIDVLQVEESEEIAPYDANGFIYEDGEVTDYRVSLNTEGRFNYNDDGSVMILDEDGAVVTSGTISEKYGYGGYSLQYSDEAVEIPLSNITSVS